MIPTRYQLTFKSKKLTFVVGERGKVFVWHRADLGSILSPFMVTLLDKAKGKQNKTKQKIMRSISFPSRYFFSLVSILLPTDFRITPLSHMINLK